MKNMYFIRYTVAVLIVLFTLNTGVAQQQLPPAQYLPHFPVAGTFYQGISSFANRTINDNASVKVPIYASSYGPAMYTIEFYNLNAPQQYFYYVEHASNVFLDSIPQGTYDVYFTDTNDVDYRSYKVGCANTQWGDVYVAFHSISISPGCNTIVIE